MRAVRREKNKNKLMFTLRHKEDDKLVHDKQNGKKIEKEGEENK